MHEEDWGEFFYLKILPEYLKNSIRAIRFSFPYIYISNIDISN